MEQTKQQQKERKKVCLNQPTHTHRKKKKKGNTYKATSFYNGNKTDNDLDLDSAGAAHPEQLSGTRVRPAVRSQPSDGRLSRPGAAVCMGCMEFEPLSKTVEKVKLLSVCSYYFIRLLEAGHTVAGFNSTDIHCTKS